MVRRASDAITRVVAACFVEMSGMIEANVPHVRANAGSAARWDTGQVCADQLVRARTQADDGKVASVLCAVSPQGRKLVYSFVQLKSKSIPALIDTGSTDSFITKAILDNIGSFV